MSKPSPLSRSSSSESLVESSSHETPAVDEQSKSPSPPVMKTKTKKSAQREAYKASANVNSSSSSTYTKKNQIGKSFETEIDAAQKLNAKKQQWAEFSKQINPWNELKLEGLKSEKIQDLADWLATSASNKVTGLELWCEHNALSEMDYKAAKALSSAIQTNTTITNLVITNSWIDDTTTKFFAEAIQANPQTKITTLDLENNLIGDPLFNSET